MTMMEESYKKNGLVKKCSKISSRPWSRKDCNGQVGVVFWGWIANMMAVKFLLSSSALLWRTDPLLKKQNK
jgi:hypothetical protein